MEIVKFTVTAYVEAGCDLAHEIDEQLLDDDRISYREITNVKVKSTNKMFPEDDGKFLDIV
jgi:hypothetical protein